MKEGEFKHTIKTFFYHLGFEVNDIPCEDNQKTPDFDVTGPNDHYTVELKIKDDDPREIEKEYQKLKKGEIVSKSIPIGRRNRLYGVIKEGVKQLEEHDPHHNTLNMIWIHSVGQYAELLNMRFHATIFGTQDLFSLEKENIITCYYFNESAFYSHRNTLDCAILTHNDKLQFCINTFSSFVDKLRSSDLYSKLANGLCDPEILLNRENVMIADCNLNRIEQKEIINFLCKKYELEHLQTIDMEMHSGTILIDSQKK